MKVIARPEGRHGWWGDQRRYEGDVFDIGDETPGSWMEPVVEEKPKPKRRAKKAVTEDEDGGE